jgi:hypothetical protein
LLHRPTIILRREIKVGDEIQDDHILWLPLNNTIYTQCSVYLSTDKATPFEVVAAKKREMGIVLETISTVSVGENWHTLFRDPL